ncbi:MAG: PAS domain-containing protein [Verrucomicrobia bacterium]|nr:PAS domain-containing protein [Verrucomicrobiota bacterium]MBI3867512.1 PAS domain-containing protein [Verrucomicrobiota bacterium]
MWPALACVSMVAALLIHLGWRRRHRQAMTQLAEAQRMRQVLEERHRGETEREKARRQTIFDSMLEGVAIVDVSLRIEMANLAFRRFMNVTSDLEGRTLASGVESLDIARFAKQLQSVGMVVGMEIVLGDPPVRILQANGSRLSGDQGYLVVLHDMTRLKEMERTRRDFVANVSHELRTPLALIKGFVETLLDGAMTDPANCARFLQTISKHTDRLIYLIEDLLTLSRLESGRIALNRQPFELRDLVQEVFDDLKSVTAERTVRLENGLDPALQVFADRGRLQQVISNLVENAIKYGRAGGAVSVGAKALPLGGVEVWVEDDGMGIPVESRTRVFERFYRVDRARSREAGGTGLGLSIVKHIVQAHGGEVWVNSELEKGSTFRFTLPADNDTQ